MEYTTHPKIYEKYSNTTTAQLCKENVLLIFWRTIRNFLADQINFANSHNFFHRQFLTFSFIIAKHSDHSHLESYSYVIQTHVKYKF